MSPNTSILRVLVMDVNEKNSGTFDHMGIERSKKLVFPVLFLLLSAGYAVAAPTVTLDMKQPVIVEDGSFQASVTISNPADEAVSVSVPNQIERGLQVSAGGNTMETSLSDPEGTQNRTIGPGQFIGKTVEFSTKKTWDRPMELRVSWTHGELSSETDAAAYYFPERKAKIKMKGYGPLFLDLYFQGAPKNIYHFTNLIRTESYYDGKEFHRLIKGFLMQGGAQDPDSTSSDKRVAFESTDRKHQLGTVSMARGRRTKQNGPQFFITLGRQHYLDGQYTVIGRVKEESRSVLKQIEEQVKTDHEEVGGECGVDHTDAPKNPLVMDTVTLITPEEYEKQSQDQEENTGNAQKDGGSSGSSTNGNNPLDESSSDGQDQ